MYVLRYQICKYIITVEVAEHFQIMFDSFTRLVSLMTPTLN